MSRFNQLLGSKYFLLVFVNTLEQQLRDFSLYDRFDYTITLVLLSRYGHPME